MPKQDLTVGIDIGTSTAKVVIADVSGSLLLQKSSSYHYDSPEPGYAEQDPDLWWNTLCKITTELLAENPGISERIAAIGVSGQGASIVFLDSEGLPTRPAMLSLDRRCSADAQSLQETHGEAILQISGKSPASYNVEPKLRWVKKNQPEVWNATAKILTPTAYITYRLSGVRVMNHSDAGIFLGYDLRGQRWSEKALEMMELPLSVYPDLADCDAVIGNITAAASDATGFPQNIAVIAGGEDTSAAGMAMGVFTPEQAQLSLGTSNTMYVPISMAITHPCLLAFPHVIASRTLIGGSMSSGGLSTHWISNILASGHADKATLADLTAEAAVVPAGSEGLIFLPYLAGELQPINDGFARGVFFGLNAEMHRGHLFRAVLEANAFAIEHNLSFARAAGASPQTLLAVGGPTRNTLLCQIIADVTGTNVKVMDESCGAALGSAILAAQGAGLCRLEDMQAAHSRPQKNYAPDTSTREIYRRRFKTYTELYLRLKDLYPTLS